MKQRNGKTKLGVTTSKCQQQIYKNPASGGKNKDKKGDKLQ